MPSLARVVQPLLEVAAESQRLLLKIANAKNSAELWIETQASHLPVRCTTNYTMLEAFLPGLGLIS